MWSIAQKYIVNVEQFTKIYRVLLLPQVEAMEYFELLGMTCDDK